MATYTGALTGLADKLVVDTAANTTEEERVTSADSGRMYIVQIDATAGSPTTDEPACYVKFADAASITGGGGSSTVPSLVLYAPLGVITSYVISGGWPFSDGLSYWAVTTAPMAGDTSPTADIKVSIVSS